MSSPDSPGGSGPGAVAPGVSVPAVAAPGVAAQGVSGPGVSGPGILVGLGLDSVEVERFGRALARRPKLAAHLFTDGERAYADGLRDPVPSLAARFAVKEAAMKALGVGLGAFAWHDVSVVRQTSGRPTLLVAGRASELAGRVGISGWQVSITHTASVASAVVAGVA